MGTKWKSVLLIVARIPVALLVCFCSPSFPCGDWVALPVSFLLFALNMLIVYISWYFPLCLMLAIKHGREIHGPSHVCSTIVPAVNIYVKGIFQQTMFD